MFEKILEIFKNEPIPEANDNESNNFFEKLWNLTLEENLRADLNYHIEFIKDIKKSDLPRMLKSYEQGRLLISTIHKVKGLEFDIVYLKSSSSKFPLDNKNNIPIEDFAREEIRLWYVGMTRAKEKLFFEWGSRENHWHKIEKFEGNQQNRFAALDGSPKEMHISWAALPENDKQHYIQEKVKIGNKVSTQGQYIVHNGETIGKFSFEAFQIIQGFNRPDLKVSDVLRYPVNPDFVKNNEYRRRGWTYVVLVSGRVS
jgi:hypothetical protein